MKSKFKRQARAFRSARRNPRRFRNIRYLIHMILASQKLTSRQMHPLSPHHYKSEFSIHSSLAQKKFDPRLLRVRAMGLTPSQRKTLPGVSRVVPLRVSLGRKALSTSTWHMRAFKLILAKIVARLLNRLIIRGRGGLGIHQLITRKGFRYNLLAHLEKEWTGLRNKSLIGRVPRESYESLIVSLRRLVLRLSYNVLSTETKTRSFSLVHSFMQFRYHRTPAFEKLLPKVKSYRSHWNSSRRLRHSFSKLLSSKPTPLLNWPSASSVNGAFRFLSSSRDYTKFSFAPSGFRSNAYNVFSSRLGETFRLAPPRKRRATFSFVTKPNLNHYYIPLKRALRASNFKIWRTRFLCDNTTRISWVDQYNHPHVSKLQEVISAYSQPSGSGGLVQPFRLSADPLGVDYQHLVPQFAGVFRHTFPFVIQTFTFFRDFPQAFPHDKLFQLGCDPWEFINFKQVKKTLFRRLIAKKYRMARWQSDYSFSDYSTFPYASVTFQPLPSLLKPLTSGTLDNTPRALMRPQFWTELSYFGKAVRYGHPTRSGNPPIIKKVRFKPGYPRIWRTERAHIKEVTGLTQRYQYRLTIKLQELYFAKRKNITRLGLARYNLYLGQSLILSHFVPDNWTATKFFENKYVYLNGIPATNPKVTLFMNDFIQLIVSLRFYILHKWIRGWAENRFKRWSRRYYRTYRIKYQLFREFKVRELPDQILTLENSWYDIPKFYEVDFFTLSSFVLVNTMGDYPTHPATNAYTELRIFNMYNWKYIT